MDADFACGGVAPEPRVVPAAGGSRRDVYVGDVHIGYLEPDEFGPGRAHWWIARVRAADPHSGSAFVPVTDVDGSLPSRTTRPAKAVARILQAAKASGVYPERG